MNANDATNFFAGMVTGGAFMSLVGLILTGMALKTASKAYTNGIAHGRAYRCPQRKEVDPADEWKTGLTLEEDDE